ncbi:sugar phosphate isomerase/epimerase family protein [Marinomonas sp. IMCC 4694]|uniref:sugar phosphate isomerase/epimerase family protein n=1 Tax=Marinomonas sp. IMCC 4694 TaxID=2605432 RepID=UPI001CA370C4|nr:hypothetical protein [Marinomonas sp. IMCC 4694]
MNLLILQSMWAMENILPNGETLPMPDAIQRIAQQGFHGVTDHMMQASHVTSLMAELKAHNLTMEGQCFPDSIDALQPTLELAAQHQPHHITIQPNIRTRNMKETIRLLEGWQRLAEQIDTPVLVETHRYRLTNDLLFTLEILAEMPNLKLLGDLSHYVVGHEIPLDENASKDIQHLQTIMSHCHAYHGRVASREQIQIPISFPQHAAWVDAFYDLWKWGFTNWKKRAQPSDTLSFTCELGTHPYAITDKNGHDITDRWKESLTLKSMAERIWQDIDLPLKT